MRIGRDARRGVGGGGTRVLSAAGTTDAKRFGRNVASMSLAQFVAQVLTLAASIVIARTLGVTAYGILAFGFAFPSWFLLLVSLGLDEVMAIEVAADRSRARRYLTLVALLRLPLAGVALAALWLATYAILADPLARTVTIVLGASTVITTYANTFTSVFRAFEKLEFGAAVTVIERSVTVGAAIVLIALGHGLYEVSLAFLGGSFLLLALSGAIAQRRFARFTRDVDGRSLAHILRQATPFGLFNAVGTFSYSTGLVLLGVLRGQTEAGLFNASFALLFALFSFLSIISLATLPMMSRIHQESRERLAAILRQMQRLSFILGIPIAFGGWFYAEQIITTFYGSAFQASVESFRVLLLCFAVETASVGIGPALAATGHAKQKLYIASAGAAVTIVLSIALIPSFGLLGAAFAFLASRILFAVVGGIVVRRYVGPLSVTAPFVKSVFASSVMLVGLLALPAQSLWTGVPLGGLIYFATVWVVRGTSYEDRLVVWHALRGALFR